MGTRVRVLSVCLVLSFCVALQAQTPVLSEFPPAPSATHAATLPNENNDTEVSAALPVELPAAPSTTQMQLEQQRFRTRVDLPPDQPQRLTSQDKFNLYLEQTYSPFTFTAAGVSAGLSQATDSPGFGQGWSAYGKRYGAALADSQTSAFFSKFLIPVLAHQDPRYKRNGKEAFFPRLFDAVSQVVDTVDDDGDPTFNYSQVLGTVVSSTIANAYYPSGSRGLLHTANRAINGLGGAAGANVLREFWPDIKRALFQRKPKPEPASELLNTPQAGAPRVKRSAPNAETNRASKPATEF
jgi:hypothetical protein